MELQIADLLNAMPGAVAQGLIWGIMAIGVYITFKIQDVADLTVDGTMSLGGAVCVTLIASGQNIWVAILAATISGMLAGLITGIFHTKMGIPVILAGILTQLGLYSINLKILGGKSNQAISADKYDLIVSLRYVKNVAFYKNTIFIGLVGLASALYSQYQGFADVNAGRGAIVIGLAAVIIGTVLFEKIFHNFALKLLSVAIGAVIYYAVLQIVIWLGLDTNYLKLLSALVVAFFLAVPYWKKKYFTKPVKKGAKTNA